MRTTQKTRWTLVTALEEIWKQAKDSKLSEEYFAKVSEPCAYVKRKLNISPIQAYVIAILMDAGKPLFLRDISGYAGCSNIVMMSYKKQLDELHERWMISWVMMTNNGNLEMGYGIRPLLVEAIQENKTFVAKPVSEYTPYEALEQIGKWIDLIDQKNLFYNETEKSHMERLDDLLSQEKYPIVKERMKEANMRSGFACLFYGSPGTGKTESVMQLARKTGRNVFQVDIARLRSKWVGDSERLVQYLFEQYEELVMESKVCPILLINEADAIISKRTSNVSSSVDKMENTIQNIILQAMERLNGIMIATTNLTENMDPAFKRRFLFKVKFDKPSVEVKARIWHSMIPSLPDEEVSLLAKSYNFSGGQIENIARKQIVEYVLSGISPDTKVIQKFCDEENIASRTKPIGFF